MNRRGFLTRLIASGVAAAVDPEELLWTPKLISIPKPRPAVSAFSRIKVGDVLTFGRSREQWVVTAVAQSGVDIKPLPAFNRNAFAMFWPSTDFDCKLQS